MPQKPIFTCRADTYGINNQKDKYPYYLQILKVGSSLANQFAEAYRSAFHGLVNELMTPKPPTMALPA